MKTNLSNNDNNCQDIIIKDKETDKDSSYSNGSSNSITSLKEKTNNFLRITGIITSSTILLLIFLTIFLYFYENSSRNYQLLLFNFNETYSPFQTHAVSAILYLLIIFTFYSVIIYSLVFKYDKDFTKTFFSKKNSKLYTLINAFVVGILFITCIFTKTIFTSILNLALLSCILLAIVVLYKFVKAKKKLSLFALLGISISTSVFMAFYTYLFLYDIADLITSIYGDPNVNDVFKQSIAIFVNVVFWGIATVLLSIYKDIVFSISLLLVEIGYVSNYSNLAANEIITGWSIIAFNIMSVIFIVIKYKKGVFGYDENDSWIKDLENEWKDNNSRKNEIDNK